MKKISSATEAEFSDQVLRQDGPVLVAFRAAWCMPSQQFESPLADVAARHDGRVKVVTVDVDDPRSDKICRRFKVNRLPVLMLFDRGRVQDYIGGATSVETANDMIEQQLRPVRDVTVHNFDAEVLQSEIPVLVHVHAAWCAPSQTLNSVVDSVAEKFRGRAKVVRLEFGPENARIMAQYGISRVPTLAVFNGGQLDDQILGAMVGGAKSETSAASCVGLSSVDNVSQMLEQFVV